MKRTFLLLQGVCSPFFARLADRLSADGHAVFKIHFNAGDAVYWGLHKASNFRGRLDDLPAFIERKFRSYGITDMVLFGDKRPVHAAALDLAKIFGVRTHVYEEGYYRPVWVTLERDGVNAHSSLPQDPDWYRAAAACLGKPAKVVRFRPNFRLRALHDMAYHTAGMFNPLLYPGYRTHAQVPAPEEYFGYTKRFAWLKMIGESEHARVRALIASGVPYFVLPLQLDGDAQIRDHSFFNNMEEVITYTLESFARHAPSNARIVIKNHPLDVGLNDYRQIVDVCERRFDLRGRTLYLEDGDLTELTATARGLVTVNSTTGFYSVEVGKPTKALCSPIYDLPGLTFQGSLNDFWSAPTPPDEQLARDFRKVLIHATQVNGGFYTPQGIELAVHNSVPWVTAERSPLDELRSTVENLRVPSEEAQWPLQIAS